MSDFNKYFIVGTNSDALHDTMNGSVVGELIRCRYFNTHSVNGDGFCSYAEPKEKET